MNTNFSANWQQPANSGIQANPGYPQAQPPTGFQPNQYARNAEEYYGIQRAGMQNMIAGAASQITGVNFIGRGQSAIGIGFSLIGAALVLAIWNIINGAALLASGMPFLEVYFFVSSPVHAIQSYGSVVLLIAGISVVVFGMTRRGSRKQPGHANAYGAPQPQGFPNNHEFPQRVSW